MEQRYLSASSLLEIPSRTSRMRIVPYEQCHVSAVKEFNRRLTMNGHDLGFPENPTPKWLPRTNDSPLFQEQFVACEDDGTVRGGYILKHQMFLVSGRRLDVGFLRWPLSEAIVNPSFSLVGALFLRDALNRNPFLYALGMGSAEEPYARLIRSVQWKILPVAFYFRVTRAKGFLRNIQYLRGTPLRRRLLDGLAASGAGTAFFQGIQLIASMPSIFLAASARESIDAFGPWADRLWEAAQHAYSMAAVRDAATLNVLYPSAGPFHRLCVKHQGEPIGWAVVLATQLADHLQFGNMRLGSIVDCMAEPGREEAVVRVAAEYLERLEVDLIVANQNHESWRSAMSRSGFSRGPTNFFFGASKGLAGLLNPLESAMPRIHLTRGDGSGPVHL